MANRQFVVALAGSITALLLATPSVGAATRELTLSPSGSDSASGSATAPLRTLGAAWRKIPLGNSDSWRLRLKAGSYTTGAPVYWEKRGGPITIENVDVFYCEQCKRVLLDHVTLRGHDAQERIKINQSSDVTVADSDIGGAGDNAFDAVAVRRIKLLRNHFHDAGDWCGCVKGGSTEVIVRGNLIL